jgi:selenocysteine lyase/cysteine desulfurase
MYKPIDVFKQTFGNPMFRTPFGKKHLIHADSTASGQSHQQVEKYIHDEILPKYNNTHSNAYSGQLMSHYITESKNEIRRSVGLDPDDKDYVVIFTGNGCTGAINHFIHCLGLCKEHKVVDEHKKVVIMISKLEHHSNLLPWYEIDNAIMEVIDVTCDTGVIDVNDLENKLKTYGTYSDISEYDIYCSFSACSNVTGVIQPVHQIAKLVHQYGGVVFFDYACSAPYVNINVCQNSDEGDYMDGIYFSPHKFIGGTQTAGVLIAHRRMFRNEKPFYKGGGTIRFVCNDYCRYSDDIETRESGGTPNIVGCIKVGIVVQLKRAYIDLICSRERELVKRVKRELLNTSNLKLLNPHKNDEQLPIFSLMIENVHYNLVVVLLNDLFGIQTRGGISCCSFYAQHILKMDETDKKTTFDQIVSGHGVPNKYGWCRVSFHYSMPDYIVTYIIRAIQFVAESAKLLKPLYVYDEVKNNWYMKDYQSDISQQSLNLTIQSKQSITYVNEKYCKEIFDQITGEITSVFGRISFG